MSTKIVTTIGPGGWETYGKRFVDSFAAYWPQHIALEVWYHDLDVVPSHPRATFHSLNDTNAFQKIRSFLGPDAKDGPSLSYCFKAVALAEAVTPAVEWLAFIDADTETLQPVNDQLLNALFDYRQDVTYLWRKSVRESEGSFFAFNLRSKLGADLLSDFWGLYISGEAFQYKKTHDNFVLDRIVNIHRAHGLRVKNLSEGALGLDAFHQSPLGAYMIHYKGPNKDAIANQGLGLPSRYSKLAEIAVHAFKDTGRADIVEVGAWNGSRAIQMAEALFAAGAKRVSYVGFDVFETPIDKVLEANSKATTTHHFVCMRLANYATYCQRKGLTFDPMVVAGNSVETLPACEGLVKNATFAYIDGGHSYETVKADYNNLRHVPHIVVDDLIMNNTAPAFDGPMRVFMEDVKGQKMIWDSGDPFEAKNGTIAFGIVAATGHPTFNMQQQIKVQPVDSVPKEEQFDFIKENTKKFKNWLKAAQAHERLAVLVSAGPTLKDFIEEIREKQKAGAVVFAVKHAYPQLKAAGITPDFTVVLDPRPVTGTSTHGIKRTKLFTNIQKGDRFLVASMTHTSVRKFLEKAGAKVIGWHALTKGVLDAKLPEFKTGLVINGGTCAAMRMPSIAFTLGFRRFDFYGFDFFYPADTDPATLKQNLITVNLGKEQKTFYTTGELIAAIQDVSQWIPWMLQNNLTVQFFGEGAGSYVWHDMQKAHNYKNPEEYSY